jgi:bifunctional DNase/RNase
MSPIQVTVAGMILDPQTRGPVLLLHVPPLDRYLPIWVGTSEAASIAMVLQGDTFERPLTHDLLAAVIDGLGGQVTKVLIHDVREGTFLAKMLLSRGTEVVSLDCRPSDALAVALRTAAPVFVDEKVVRIERDHLLTFDEEETKALFGDAGSPTVPGGNFGLRPCGGRSEAEGCHDTDDATDDLAGGAADEPDEPDEDDEGEDGS